MMLERLIVKNLAIVESVEAEFGNGLNIITGETGAGKSVLMGALELALGARADASAVRDGASEASISAEFVIDGMVGRVVPNAPDGGECGGLGTSRPTIATDAISKLLDDAGLPPCEGGVLIIRRTISAGGGSRVRINDAPSTVQTLRAIGRLLVDLHGPNDNQSLLEESFQRNLLDAWGGIDRVQYNAAWARLSSLRREADALRGDSSDLQAEAERLRYSVDEIESAQLTEEDETELPSRHAAAAHAAEIVECASAATSALSGDDASAANALISAGHAVAEMARHYPQAAEWSGEIESLTIRAQELSTAIESAASRIDADPETLQALDDRISLVQKLKRKYSCTTVDELLALRDFRAARLADIDGHEERMAALSAALVSAEADVRKAGAVLSTARAKAAARFSRAVTKELHGLGFLKSNLSVAVSPREPDASGCDAVECLFAPNPGEPSRPLKAIASSGEIARVMLAVKTVSSEHDAIPVLVFDEIDSNIGGETGRAVGERLRAVAKHHQVIAITHLPQSAVYGERHLAVAKSVSGGRTRTVVRPLEGEERVAEIARMLGGAGLTSVVERHARELLAAAE